MDQDEMVAIAEGIARDPRSYPSARMSALRFLKELDDIGDEDVRDEFAELDELAPKRRARTKPRGASSPPRAR
jgi:hypothetical protein